MRDRTRDLKIPALVLTLAVVCPVSGAASGYERDPDPAIVFMAYSSSGPADLMVMDQDGATVRVLLASADTESTYSAHRWPRWSPDGLWIVFASQMPARPADHPELDAIGPGLYMIGVGGAPLCQIAPLHSIHNPYPAWSPAPPSGGGGPKILYADVVEDRPRESPWRGQWDLFLVDAACGATPANITRTPNRDELYTTWSPDARQIAATVRELEGQPRGGFADVVIYELRGESVAEVRRPGRPQSCTAAIFPNWSHKGDRLSACCVNEEGGSLWIYSFARDSWARLTSVGQGGLRSIWSPDDAQILFDHEDDAALSLIATEPGSPSRPLTQPPQDSSARYIGPDWRPAAGPGCDEER